MRRYIPALPVKNPLSREGKREKAREITVKGRQGKEYLAHHRASFLRLQAANLSLTQEETRARPLLYLPQQMILWHQRLHIRHYHVSSSIPLLFHSDNPLFSYYTTLGFG